MLSTIKKITGGAVLALCTVACTDTLEQFPHIGANSETVYSTAEGYRAVMAKVYATYSLCGQEKGGGNGDIDAGHDLLRNLFDIQESGTDECAMSWLSGGIGQLSYLTWDSANPSISNIYYRLYYSIALCNEFLRYSTPERTSSFSQQDKEMIAYFAAEARFMRALGYSLVLDLFRQGPFVDENTPTTGFIPEAYDGKMLYDFIMDEIKEIEPLMKEPNSYGRAGKAALYALAARVTLNAEVYTGEKHYDECVGWCKKILDLDYTLENDYHKLFNADNHKRTNEILFAFVNDATEAVTWGAATYLVCGSCSSDTDQQPASVGVASGWGSWRIRGEFYNLFPDGEADSRCMFYTEGQQQMIPGGLENRAQGFYSTKWTNLTDDGEIASDTNADGVNTDVPYFRLAEVYLTAAEATLRGGQGMSRSEARELVNQVRRRAYGDTLHDVSDSQFSLEFMLDERGRELYHEYLRRTDLVRYGLFTGGDYVWQWKGGVVDGKAVDERYDIYPIPVSELSANPNLKNELY